MARGSVEISIYHAPSPADPLETVPRRDAAPLPPSLLRTPRATPRAVVSAVAATLAIALHVLLMTSMMWGEGRTEKPRDPRGPGALQVAAPETTDDGAMQVILIEEPSSFESATARQAAMAAPSPKLASIPLIDPLADLSLELPQVSPDDSSRSATASEDSAMRSAMYGRYLGQISARISRAWLRPRSAIGAPMFSCRVRIDQDRRGNVQDVTLEDCNGDPRWQLSLVQAIESASPLPAPPDPHVFTRIVHAYFESHAYGPGSPGAEYEPEAIAEAAALAAQPQVNEEALSAFEDALRRHAPKHVISLSLSGTGHSGPLRAQPTVPPVGALPSDSSAAAPPAPAPGQSGESNP